jgi:hypothetical protein
MMSSGGKGKIIGEKSAPATLRPPKILFEVARD